MGSHESLYSNYNWKILILLLFIFGISRAVFGNDCKSIEPQDNFDIKKFSGNWYLMGLDVPNPTVADRFGGLKCPGIRVELKNGENKPNDWIIEHFIGDILVNISATYTVPDLSKGFLKIIYKEPEVGFDYTIMCTDLLTYAVGYACSQITPDITTEFYAIALKDPMKYDETIAKPEIEKCIEDMSAKPIGQWLFRDIPFENCPNRN